MLKTITRDILKIEQGFIFHQVNLGYAMGAGLAKQVVRRHPLLRPAIHSVFPRLGQSHVYIPNEDKTFFIVSLVAQETMGVSGKHTLYWAFAAALHHFDENWMIEDDSIYFPHKIGCGLGGGDWHVVHALIEETFPQAIICRLPSKKVIILPVRQGRGGVK